MSNKRLPSKLTIEELLDALNNPDVKDESVETIINDVDNDALLFLTTFKISNGTDPIKKKLLYKLYRQWSKEPISQISFTIKATDYIDHKVDNYYINENVFKISKKIKDSIKKKPDVTKSKNKWKHFTYFLNKFNIVKWKTGPYMWIECYHLYYLYDNWVYSNNKRPLFGYNNFSKLLNTFIGPCVRGGSRRNFYKIQISDSLNSEFIAKAKEWSKSRMSQPIRKDPNIPSTMRVIHQFEKRKIDEKEKQQKKQDKIRRAKARAELKK